MTHLLCLGDSITDCGRLFQNPPLGSGYVYLLSQKLKENKMNLRITNCGVDGFTTSRLLANAELFYLPLKADVITILIGINDIGLIMNTSFLPGQQEKILNHSLAQYRKLLLCLSQANCPIILMEPFIFPWPLEYQNWISPVRNMSQGIGHLAEEFHCPFIRLHDFLNEQAQLLGTETLTPDGIHLTETGHHLLAEKLYQQLMDILEKESASQVSTHIT